MPKKAGPSLLCEWMVGTTIKSALGPPPKPPKPKPKRRDVIKLHVTTDDESVEDTLTVTYPRPERLIERKETQAAVPTTPEPQPEPESEPESEVVEVVKKVRFEKEATPKKSAMKKKTLVTFCEEEETKSDSSVDATSTSASSGEATPEASSSNVSSAAETSSAGETSESSSISSKASKSTRSPKNKKIEKPVQSSDSETDSEPHPTCECKECASSRKKQKQGATCEKKKCKKNDRKRTTKKKKETETASEVEASVSEAESSAEEEATPSKKPKEKRKEKKKAEVSSAEGEASESAKETEGESKVTVKKSPDKKKKNKNSEKASSPQGEGKKKPGEEKEPEKEKGAEEPKPEQTPTGKGKGKEVDNSNKPATAEDTAPTPQTKDMGQKLHCSEGYHYTHSRPPNIIAPIRAEVMQTERVVATQDDPPPNAYYDALHGVVRVYHGSVYGQNGHHMFAARENAAGLPHPLGNSHLGQNPYYQGYNNVMPMTLSQQQLPPHGYEHVPITQGMPMPGWNAIVPPPGYPPYNYQGGLPPISAAWYEQQLNRQGTKGAFSMYNGAGGTPDGKENNKSREPGNNVMPEAAKPNPYYTKRQSPFSNMGSHRSASNGKPPSHSGHSNCSKNGGGSQRDNRDTGPNWDAASRRSVGAWANSSNHGATWGDGGGDANNNNNQGGGDQWGSGGGGGDTWGTTNNNNDQWNNNNNDDNTGVDRWGAGAGNDQDNRGGWGTTDNANNGGGTWGDGNANDNQQTNDNNGNNGGQGQGQNQDQCQSNSPAGRNEPPTSIVDNNVIPVAAVTGPPSEQEQSKMPGSWCSDDNGQAAFVDPTWPAYQPPSAVPAWGDPSMAANTGGAVDW
ncbi:hypothetical protein V8C42DRAFT_363798 [Trichoderma barbatum]